MTLPKRVDGETVATLRHSYPEECATLSDEDVLALYGYAGRAYEQPALWDHLGDAERNYNEAADEVFRLQAKLESLKEEFTALGIGSHRAIRRDTAKLAGRAASLRRLQIEIAWLHEDVEHWRRKANCYGNIVHGCSPVLEAAGFPVDCSMDAGGAVGGIRRSVEELAKDRDRLRDENAVLRDVVTQFAKSQNP